jgi:hypothetical protein
MKKKFWFILVLLLTVFMVVGCDNEPVEDPDPEEELTEYSVLGYWTEGHDEVYSITTNTTSKLAFNYAKGDVEDAFLVKPIIGEDLSIYKKLVITVLGMGGIEVQLVKNANVMRKVSLNVTAASASYEWNLMNDSEFLKGVTEVRIIAAPGKKNLNGNVEVTMMKFVNVVADNYIIQSDFNNIPDNVNDYDGTSETFNFNARWQKFVEEETDYVISTVGTKTHVEVDKKDLGGYPCIESKVRGDFSGFNYLVGKFKGTDKMPIIFKAANGYETQALMNGEEVIVVVDFSAMTPEEKNSISSIFLFAYPGNYKGTGYLDIIEAYMTSTYDIDIATNVYNGTDPSFSLVNWYDASLGGDYDITNVTESNSDTVIAYEKSDSYTYAETYFEGDLSRFGAIEIQVTGTEQKSVMFKLEGGGENVEFPIEFTGNKQTVLMPLTSISAKAIQSANKLLVFAAPGDNEDTGSFTIHSVKFVDYKLDISDVDWVSNDAGVYTFTKNEDGSIKVDYDKSAGGLPWAFMKQEFAGDNYKDFSTLTLVLRGTAGNTIKVKPNDAFILERDVTFEEGKDVTLTYTIDEYFSNLLIFAAPDEDLVTGSFTIVSATLGFVRKYPADQEEDVDVNHGWMWYTDSGDSGVYKITEADGKTVVSYQRETVAWSQYIKVEFEEYMPYHNTVVLLVKGEAGRNILVKLNDKTIYEKTVELTGDVQEVLITLNKDELPSSIVIYADPGASEGEGLSGSFEIVEAFVTYISDPVDPKNDVDVNDNWLDNDNVYEIQKDAESGKVSISYADRTNSWAFIKVNFEGNLSLHNAIKMVVKGVDGTQLIIKPNDNGAFEKTVDLDGTEQEVILPVVDPKNLLVFIDPINGSSSGSLEIVSAVVTYDLSTVELENWVDNGDGVYTFEDVEDGVKVTYDKGDYSYPAMRVELDAPLKYYNAFTIVVKGEAGKSILVKPNDKFEHRIDFTGEEQTLTIMMNEDPYKVIIMAEGGTTNVSGNFTIISAEFSYIKETLDLNDNWVDNDGEVYTITSSDDGYVISYEDREAAWAFIYVEYEGFTRDHTTLEVVVNGEAGKQLIIKPNDKGYLEQTVDLTGEDQTVTFNMTEPFFKLIIFSDPINASTSGSYTIKSVELK